MNAQPALRCLFLGLALWTASAQATTWQVLVLGGSDDPRLERKRLEQGYPGHPGGAVEAAVRVAAAEAQSTLATSGHQIKLSFASVPVADAQAAQREIAKAAPDFVLLDLPAATQKALMKEHAKLKHRPVVFNVSEPADELRGAACHPHWLHTLPSDRMHSDALAQWLASRSWRDIIWLVGTRAQDQALTEVWQASFKRFGLKVRAQRSFVLSGDPRQRNAGNPKLLTAEPSHDAVVVLDTDGEFARTVPYNTAQARPVAGHAGLVPLAWHPRFDRFGAPQLNRRFIKQAARPMTGHDWAAWVAVKAITAALEEKPKASLPQHLQALRSGAVGVDGFKGVTLSFRPWDGQLRQPVFLAHGDGVAAAAPVDGAMHPKDVLDTLGADEGDSACKAR